MDEKKLEEIKKIHKELEKWDKFYKEQGEQPYRILVGKKFYDEIVDDPNHPLHQYIKQN